ncbi:hypothetical protein L596_025877 [Steinernema carpocapsae]|uniref:ADF-H domain-containing protein n=1 Tax=Steinernema carpocapsae TaxID=34508 RepID=A0A4U5M941_STECR|nr:hypothetical protein L596_025877 [Steinernema carpocapsae]
MLRLDYCRRVILRYGNGAICLNTIKLFSKLTQRVYGMSVRSNSTFRRLMRLDSIPTGLARHVNACLRLCDVRKMSGTISICHIPNDLKAKLRAFRFQKSTATNVLILKIDRETHTLIIEEDMQDCGDLEEVKDELPHQQPRYLLISYQLKHSDGRVSYPMCLVFYSPTGCHPEQQMLYAGSRNSLVQECELTKNFEIRDLDEFTSEFLDSKLKP